MPITRMICCTAARLCHRSLVPQTGLRVLSAGLGIYIQSRTFLCLQTPSCVQCLKYALGLVRSLGVLEYARRKQHLKILLSGVYRDSKICWTKINNILREQSALYYEGL